MRVEGFLVNRDRPLLPISKHWFAIRRLGAVFYNLDSRNATPWPYATFQVLLEYLRDALASGRVHIIVVTSEPVALADLLDAAPRAATASAPAPGPAPP